MKNLEEKSLVVKSNRLIEASYRLTTQEQRLILLMASMIRSDDVDFHTYQIRVKDFNDIIGIKDKAGYRKTKDLTKKLLSRILEIRSERSLLQISWLSSAEYFEGQGYVELSFDPKLKPYLLQIKKYFTQYRLKDVIRLKSFYSVRLYELLKQYEKIGQRAVDLEELRHVLGIRPNEYKLYGHMKNRVIRPAQKELNSKTDIRFEFKEQKTGRKVTGLTFVIYRKKEEPAENLWEVPEEAELEKSGISNKELYEKLVKYFCLSNAQAQEIVKKYDTERIEENLSYVEDKYNKSLISDIAPYTIKAIKEDYRLQRSLFDIEKEEKEQEQEKRNALQRLSERLEEEYRSLKVSAAKKMRESLSEAEISQIEAMVEQDLEKKGQTGIGKDLFFRLGMEEHLARKAGLPAFTEWRQKRMKELQK